jgi:hypothetical protein
MGKSLDPPEYVDKRQGGRVKDASRVTGDSRADTSVGCYCLRCSDDTDQVDTHLTRTTDRGHNEDERSGVQRQQDVSEGGQSHCVGSGLTKKDRAGGASSTSSGGQTGETGDIQHYSK